MKIYSMRAVFIAPCILIATMHFTFAQHVIVLANASFEDNPQIGRSTSIPIWKWQDCGSIYFPGESPPDILPTRQYNWGVKTNAHDGHHYLALVTRYNGSWESISQKLQGEVTAQKCYAVDIYLSLSPVYDSPTPRSTTVDTLGYKRFSIHKPDGPMIGEAEKDRMVRRYMDSNPEYRRTHSESQPDMFIPVTSNDVTLESFSHPVTFQIWGGQEFCDKAVLLARTIPVAHHDWQQYSLTFSPSKNFRYITIEAYYADDVVEPYNGHVLVDGLSSIREISCY